MTFVLTPILVRSLGDARYGLWSLFGVVGLNAHLLLLGLPTAVERHLAVANADHDPEAVRRIFSTALAAFLVGGALVLVAAEGFAAALATGSIRLFPETAAFDGAAREIALAAAIFGFNIAIEFPASAAFGAIASGLRHDILSIALTARMALRFGFGLTALAIAPRLDTLAAAILAADAIVHTTNFIVARRVAPACRFSRQSVSGPVFRRLLDSGGFNFLSNLAQQSLFHFDLLIIAAMSGPVAVAYYSVAVQLIQRIQTISRRTFVVFMPVFAGYASRGPTEALKTRFLFVLRISTFFAAASCGAAAIFGGVFVSAWIGPDYAAAVGAALAVLAVGAGVELSQAPMRRLAVAFDIHRFYAFVDIAVGALSIALTFALIEPFGLVGAALGTTLPLIVYGAVVKPAFTKRSTGLSLRRIFAAQARTGIPTLALQAPIAFALHYVKPDGLVEVVLLGAVSYGALGLAALFVVLPKQDARQLVSVLPNRLRRPIVRFLPVFAAPPA